MAYKDDFTWARKMAGLKFSFYIHLAAYVIVNLVLLAVNLATSPGNLWFVWPLLGWGIGILAHGLVAFTLPLGGSFRRRLIENEMRKTRP